MPDLTKINKTIRDIRKENHAEDIILRNLDFTFYLEKDPCESEKTVSAFNNNYTQYKSKIDKDNTLFNDDYLDEIKPYLSDITMRL